MSAPPDRDPATQLGHAVASRLRLPGPTAGHSRPSRIGSVATASTRFAGSILRSVAIRSALEGPAQARVNSYRDAGLAPPRWWSPEFPMMIEQRRRAARSLLGDIEQRPVSDLPSRTLPRAVRRVPDEQTWTPGGIVETLVSEPLPVRRLEATSAAGPMLMQHDRAKLNASQALIFKRKTAPAKAPEFRSYSGRKPPPPPPSIRRSGRGSGGGTSGGGTGGGGGAFTAPRPGSAQRHGGAGGRQANSSPAGSGASPPAPQGRPGDGSRPSGPTARARGEVAGPSWMPSRVLRFPASSPAMPGGLAPAAGDARSASTTARATALAVVGGTRAGDAGVDVGAGAPLDGLTGGFPDWLDGPGESATLLRSAFRTDMRRAGAMPRRPLYRGSGSLYRNSGSAGQMVGPLRRVVGGPHAVHPRLRIADATPGMRMVPRRPDGSGDPGEASQPGRAGSDVAAGRRPDPARVRALRAARMAAAHARDASGTIARTPLDGRLDAGTAASSAGSAGSAGSADGAASATSGAAQAVRRRADSAAAGQPMGRDGSHDGTEGWSEGAAGWSEGAAGWSEGAAGWSEGAAGRDDAGWRLADQATPGREADHVRRAHRAQPAYRGYRGGRGGGLTRGVGFASFTLLRSSAQPNTMINPRTAAHRLPALGAVGAAGLLGMHLASAPGSGDGRYSGTRAVAGRTALVPQGGGAHATALRRSAGAALDAAVLLQAIQSVSLPAGTSLDPVVLRRSIQAAGSHTGAGLDPTVLRRAIQAAAVPGTSAVDPAVLRRAIESAALPTAASVDVTVLRRAIQAAGLPPGTSLDAAVLRRAIQRAGITGSAVGVPAALAAAIAQSVRADSAPAMAGAGTSMSMPDLLVTQRGASHGARSERGTSLATGFGSAELIRPAGARATGDAVLAPPMGSPGAFGAGRGGPVPSLRRRLAADATGRSSGAGGMRGYLPAPPPVSFRPPGAAAGTTGPGGVRRSASPAAAAAAAATAMTTAGGGDLLARTAHLFAGNVADMADNMEIRRSRAEAGETMSRQSGPALRVVPTSPLSTASDGDADPFEFLDDPNNLDQLVDKVVDRIERRVIDELERRGRRHRPGVF